MKIWKHYFASAWETFGRLDVVIANAGVINFGYTLGIKLMNKLKK